MAKNPEVLIYFICACCLEENEISVYFIPSAKKSDKKEVKIFQFSSKIKQKKF